MKIKKTPQGFARILPSAIEKDTEDKSLYYSYRTADLPFFLRSRLAPAISILLLKYTP